MNLTNKFKAIWRSGVGVTGMIIKLNQLITGRGYYHRFVNANETFRKLDNFNYLQSVRFLKRQHPNKGWNWLTNKYF